jgi:uncharacterized protein
MIVDSDVHNEVEAITTLYPYLPEHWVEQINNTRFNGPFDFDSAYPRGTDWAIRPGSRCDGGYPDLATVCSQALTDVDRAILICTYAVDSLHNPDQAIALARAVNDWQIAEWLDKDDRLRASIVVPPQTPAAAADEIERVGDHPGFVQVALPVRAHLPYGNRIYHPMWEAVARHDLVGGIYFGGAPGNPPTPVGWPSYFVEEYANAAATFAGQVTNMVVEGLFDKFESLRITLVESGATWLPNHMWRFDKEWKNLRLQVPWVRRPPSSYIRDHFRLTIEPWDGPCDPKRNQQLLDHLGADDMLLDASGYPHLPSGERSQLLAAASTTASDQMRGGNAQAWYRL